MEDAAKINEYLASLSGWQKANLEKFRALVHKVEPDIQEAWKWDVPVFLVRGKLVCAMSTFKEHTKYNFFNGAQLTDSHKLFNSGLESKRNRSINLQAGEQVDESALAQLIAEAVNG